jgi:hypothetical protein
MNTMSYGVLREYQYHSLDARRVTTKSRIVLNVPGSDLEERRWL